MEQPLPIIGSYFGRGFQVFRELPSYLPHLHFPSKAQRVHQVLEAFFLRHFE